MKITKFTKFLVLCVCFSAVQSYGGVNYKNGNFYVSYTDIVVPGEERTLKSLGRTLSFDSLAGLAWGGEANLKRNLKSEQTVLL